MFVDVGDEGRPGKTFGALLLMAVNGVCGRDDGCAAGWFLFGCVGARSNGHGCRRSGWGTDIQDDKENGKDEDKWA